MPYRVDVIFQPRGGTEKGPKVLRQGGLIERLSGGGESLHIRDTNEYIFTVSFFKRVELVNEI